MGAISTCLYAWKAMMEERRGWGIESSSALAGQKEGLALAMSVDHLISVMREEKANAVGW